MRGSASVGEWSLLANNRVLLRPGTLYTLRTLRMQRMVLQLLCRCTRA